MVYWEPASVKSCRVYAVFTWFGREALLCHFLDCCVKTAEKPCLRFGHTSTLRIL